MNQQAMLNMLLNQLRGTNPGKYNQIMSLMNSGQNPQSIINNMINTGQVTREQVNQAQNMLNNPGNNNPGFRRF